MNRRTFLIGGGLPLAPWRAALAGGRTPVDFRYAPRNRQASFCFPDDPYKSLVGAAGDLRYGYARGKSADYFQTVVEFSLRGLEADRPGWQRLEAPAIPIVHTRIDRPAAFLELTTFATNRAGEGRVDNVILVVRPKSRREVLAGPQVRVRTRANLVAKNEAGLGRVVLENGALFLAADRPLRAAELGDGFLLSLTDEPTRGDRPLRLFFRFPQEGQSSVAVNDPEGLLAEARAWWNVWTPFGGAVGWRLPAIYNDFLVGCARNILQARERRNGRLTFQVGPTVYRGLWVVDGNFILEAARYLGYDAEAQQGLETTWAMQGAEGGIFAGGGNQHWKDTGIAMFTLVRQAELSQDWRYFRQMQPQVLKAAAFLGAIRERGRTEGSVNGRYGLLARGFGDGGIGGVRDEFTNTIWALAGLKAVADAAERQSMPGFEPVRELYRDLSASFVRAARQEMMRHADGFEFLPMILREDPGWSDPDPWKRWRPQTGQWALAQTIFPGLLFDRRDPIVQGYIALMQSCTREEVPAETGWLPHDGLWNYDAGFAAHVYLWAGVPDWALETFHGFLNHATPLYCWREEQPLHGALVGGTVGDMPHNWASAECVLFLRHLLALEDGGVLRLLPGVGEAQLAAGDACRLRQSPTRFGRIDLDFEPLDGRRGWSLKFARGRGPAPDAVRLPETLGGFRLVEPVDLRAPSWTATWR